ncbi:flavin reductase family protein [Streptomyces sp. NPDC001093]|uniref:flavin reductase family protein n=1 Tax=Streptomyces sp. NPDC001093 TaxID=3154376 RepID=UPI00332B4693
MPATATPPTLQSLIDPAEFRRVLGHFCSGLTIITSLATARGGTSADEPVGFTCQSFASLSLDPPLVTFSVARTSTTWPRIEPSGAFCANILSAGQEALCRSFAVRGSDKFSGVAWTPGPGTGSPVLSGSLAWADCTVEAVHPGGDHWIVVGRVRAVEVAEPDAAPLLFYRSAFHRPAA